MIYKRMTRIYIFFKKREIGKFSLGDGKNKENTQNAIREIIYPWDLKYSTIIYWKAQTNKIKNE